jgi:ABC-type branched-subunit amino acid transport system ATPase component
MIMLSKGEIMFDGPPGELSANAALLETHLGV